jgi:nifR3 family TIM-barrel protein
MENFWKKLPKPFFCLAPMADVTDCAFRQIIAGIGKPDIFWTEFVSADGLAHPQAREKLLIDFKYSLNEHPIVAQIFGSQKENMRTTAKLCKELGFNGVDINMGCPDKAIERQGSGSGMIRNPNLAREIIRAVKEGAEGLPVSVKTRIGYNKNEIETWIRELLSEDLAALTIHLRTRKEMSKVPAHWELMKRIVEIRDEMKKKTLIIGNGDILSIKEAKEKAQETGCDGIMLGKAIFGNPWLFSQKKNFSPTVAEKLKVMVEHTQLFERMLGKHKNFAIMRKHYKAYVNGFDGAKELRVKLMETENADQVENTVSDFLKRI